MRLTDIFSNSCILQANCELVSKMYSIFNRFENNLIIFFVYQSSTRDMCCDRHKAELSIKNIYIDLKTL